MNDPAASTSPLEQQVPLGSRPDELLDGYIFDLDGTLYLGDEALSGAVDLVASLRKLNRRILMLTNNPTRLPEQYVEKLNRLGFAVEPADVLTTVATMVAWLQQHASDATVFPVSEEPLKQALRTAGIRMSERPEEIDLVIASYDRGFTYRKLQIAFDAIHVHGRARLITTNPDRFCPFPGGEGEPDAGAIIGAIEGCTGVRCSQNVGKPDPFMLEAALQRLDLPAERCVMVGDRLTTDIRMAIDAGMPSALVLTGETTRDMLTTQPNEALPTWVLKDVTELLPAQM